jgi:hypothetical protein
MRFCAKSYKSRLYLFFSPKNFQNDEVGRGGVMSGLSTVKWWVMGGRAGDIKQNVTKTL